jgi:hypothetical protein
VPQEFQKAFAQKPDVQALAQKVGIDLTKLPAPPDAVLAGTGQPAQPGRTTDATQQSATTTDASQQPAQIAGLSPENQGLRPDQIMAKAQQQLQQTGMTDAVKKQFGDAIKVADSMYGPDDQKMTDQLINVLQTGKKADGTAITPDERVQAHQLVQQEFSRATLGMQYRMAYGTLLNQNKQYATAEGVFKDNIAGADKLPLASFQAELTQLGKDVQNPQISRANQADLFTMMQGIQGSGTSKDDPSALLYMPITARKQAALFYVGGADGSGVGIVKPELAAAMIDQTTAKEKALYGVTDDKLKAFDPTLANMAQGIIPLLPENLRKEKQKADSFWSNAIVDGGTAAAVITLAGLTASLITRNPKIFGMMVEGEGAAAKLSLTGYAAVGAGAFGTEVVARHTVHQLVTGENEGWDKSLIHGAAGLGAVAAIMGTRSLASKFLYNGATVEGASARISTEMGLGADAPIGKFVSAVGGKTTLTPGLQALEGSLEPMMVDGAVNPKLAAELAKYSPAQLTTLTQTFMKDGAEVAGSSAKWYAPSNVASKVAGANPFSALDLTTATTGKLAMRSFYSGYSSAFGAIGAYSSISSLDRPIDPKTGKPVSYADSFIQSNYRSMSDNTAVDALWLGIMPAMKDGVLAKSVYAEGAGPIGKTWGYFKAPFKVSTFGSMGAEAAGVGNYTKLGLQASQLAIGSTFYNFSNLSKVFQGGMQSRAIGHQLDAMNADAPATPVKPVQDNGQPIQDQPVTNPPADKTQQQQPPGGLTAGTPGLGG